MGQTEAKVRGNISLERTFQDTCTIELRANEVGVAESTLMLRYGGLAVGCCAQLCNPAWTLD